VIGQAGRHQRYQALAEKHAHLVQHSADGQKCVEQGDTSEEWREVYPAPREGIKANSKSKTPRRARTGRLEFGGW
jgi:hypothetical protein